MRLRLYTLDVFTDRGFGGNPLAVFPEADELTSGQMQSLARQWMPLDKMTVVVVGDLAKIEQQVRALPELQGMPIDRVDPFAAS